MEDPRVFAVLSCNEGYIEQNRILQLPVQDVQVFQVDPVEGSAAVSVQPMLYAFLSIDHIDHFLSVLLGGCCE